MTQSDDPVVTHPADLAQIASAEEAAAPARWQGWKHATAVLVAIAMACFSYVLFTQHNDYPLRYHVGEGTKIRQLMDPTGARDFNHPLLMLETAGFLQHWWHVPNDERAIAITGRSASALLAAIGAGAAALAGYLLYRWIGLLVLGASISLCPPLLIFAHHLKEDASLGGGMLLAVMGIAMLFAAQRTWTQLLATAAVGIGCAAAASGKYIGAATLVPCILAVLIARNKRWPALPVRIVIFLLSLVATILVIDHRAFVDFATLQLHPIALKDMEAEFDHGTTGHQILALSTPNLYCLRLAAADMMPQTWLALLAGMTWIIARRRISRWGITLAVFLLVYVSALSFDAIPIARYGFPISLLGFVIAASMLCAILSNVTPRWRTLATSGILLVIVLLQGWRCVHFNREFADDTRQKMHDWVAALPAGTLISADDYTELSTEMQDGDPWRHPHQPTIRASIPHYFYAAQAGSLEDQARRNITYVATCDAIYERFFIPGVRALPQHQAEFDSYKHFYENLFQRGQLVWSSSPSVVTHTYLDMDLRIYRISNLAGAPTTRPDRPDSQRRR